MTVWRVSWRARDNRGEEMAHDHESEDAAMQYAEELARTGVLAFVYPIGGVEG